MSSFHRTHRYFASFFFSQALKRWEQRSLDEHLKDPKGQAMYSVIHGGMDKKLRKQSIEILSSLEFNGHAIGSNEIYGGC
jgi:tRNA-guanine family transglycosylase